MVVIKDLLRKMLEENASDLHIGVGTPPTMRVNGVLKPVDSVGKLTPAEAKDLIYSILNEEQIKEFESEKELDMSFGIEGLSRFRVNVYQDRGSTVAAFRAIPFEIRSLEELGLPVVVGEFANKPQGLILVCGPTGSGKSTTLAALIDKINVERSYHIVTIEDPIEYLHKHKNSVVNQREVRSDTKSFAASLRHVLRQDPDVILIGEMRDLETVSAALTVAETGHLVFATLHTNDAAQTINRIIDVFPERQQSQIRTQLSFVLEGVVVQQLLPRMSEPGRILAVEIMVPTPAIRSLIREEKVHQIYSHISTGGGIGMMTMNQSLYQLYRRNLISRETAFKRSTNPDDLKRLMENQY
jgi:twitching motility protein PilT